MPVRRLLLALLAISSVGQGAEWKEEPTEFKGVKFGSLQRDIASTATIPVNSCTKISGTDSLCHSVMDAGKFKILVTFMFHDEKMQSVLAEFPARNFSDIAELLQVKYGVAHLEDKGDLYWTGKGVDVTAVRQGTSADTGVFAIEINQAAKKQADDKIRPLNKSVLQ
jgi:hypothetical protein